MKPESAPSRSARRRAVREMVVYGAAGGVLIAVLKLVEARFLLAEGPYALYGGLIALLFAGVGIWLLPVGLVLTTLSAAVLRKR